MTTTNILADHRNVDIHTVCVGEDPNTRGDHSGCDTHLSPVVPGPDQLNGHCRHDTQNSIAVEPLHPQPANISASPKDVSPVGVPTPPDPAKRPTTPMAGTLVLADPLLALAADVLDDLERVRIANENRLRQLTRDETDKDGEERGFGLTLDHPDVARLAALVDDLKQAEHDATLNLKRMVRRHLLGPWIKAAKGVGEKQGARLLASIGDPYWNTLHGRPRTVSELWSYCGYHVLPASQTPVDTQIASAGGALNSSNPDQTLNGTQTRIVGVAATRQRGTKINWSATAKMRARLIAESIVKAGGPYREIYDEGRTKYADAVHQVECKRCGPAGEPAQPGSALSDGHKHARALRLVSKTILRDLWREAKRLHELPPAAIRAAIPKRVSPLGETTEAGEP
jgi:hypothetical protein